MSDANTRSHEPPPGSTTGAVLAFLHAHRDASLESLLDLILADQARRYEAGCPVPVEEYLTVAPWLAFDRERKLDLVYGDFCTARRAGRPADPQSLLERFPDLADDLRLHLALDEAVTRDEAAATNSIAQTVLPRGPGAEVPHRSGYEFIRELGRGGFGSVWLARHLALDKLVAVKHLHPERLSSHADQLAREARTMAALKVHPNRVTVFDLVQAPDGWLLVMDYVDGGPLGGLVGPGRQLDWVRAARYVADVAEGLADVHARGVLHRDIKPDNILLDRERDAAVLTDFGLSARVADAQGCCGTVGYMAPELFDGVSTPKTDVFALAATLFHLVTGHKPFASGDLGGARRQAEAGPSAATLAELPAALAAVVRAGLNPAPDRRPDLAGFVAGLRGCHTAGLADRLRTLASSQPAAVRLTTTVSTALEKDLAFRIVFSGPLVGASPTVRCDEVVRIEASADADGYLTVLNLGSGGEVGVLFPNTRSADNRVRAGRPMRVTVRLTPPAGTDHAVLVWTPAPCVLTPREWREQLEAGRLAVEVPVDRGMEFVAADAPEPTGPGWMAAVVSIEHGG